MARRPSSVCLSVRPSVNFCANRFFSRANGPIANKLAHDGLQVSMHPGCAQGQRSRDTPTWILGMSYSVIDGLVAVFKESMTLNLAQGSFKVIGGNQKPEYDFITFALSSTVSKILPVLYAPSQLCK